MFDRSPDAARIVRDLPDSVLMISGDGTVRWGNRAAEQLFGTTIQDAVGKNVLDFVHPEDWQLAALAAASVQRKSVGSLLELRVRGPEGWRLAEVRGAPFEGDSILLSVRDITDRRRWEVAGDQTARFRSLLQNAASITLLMSADAIVRAASGGLTRLLGHDQEWLEGRPLADLAAEEDRARLEAELRSVADGDGGVHRTFDVGLRAATGETVPFALTCTNLLDDPTVEGLVVTGHDVSDRVQAEYALRAANSLLAATLESTADGILVVDRTGQIASFNARFAEMWNVPPEVLRARDDREALQYVLGQLRDPAAFVNKVEELYSAPEVHSHDLVEFNDGRVFERDSLPQYIDNEVAGRVWSFRDVTDQQRLQHELSHQALHDALTGLPNQVLLRDRIGHAVDRLHRTPGRVAVMFVDLDDFKLVNDSLGHWAGDVLLVRVSERLREHIRPGDTAARLGGDEFAILLDGLGEPGEAVRVAERIIAALQTPLVLAGKQLAVTASIGIAFGHAGANADELLRNADLAMYSAKGAGKNRQRVFAEEMHVAAVARLDLESSLRAAIRHGDLVVQYQPIYELSSNRIWAAEALVRWRHPQRGLLPPNMFVPLAEQNGLIHDIGLQVLERACTEAARWVRDAGDVPPAALAVNLSAHQLQYRHLADDIAEILRAADLDPRRLILEITENALVHDADNAAARLDELNELGCRISIDDFGTGSSALASLPRFPIDILKIDECFVRETLDRPTGSVAQALVQLARTLGVTPIAEGIEHASQLETLRLAGCDLAQGYFLCRPVSEDDVRALIEGNRRLAAGKSSAT